MDFTNATFYVTKLRDHPIGRSVRLPKYILENPTIMSKQDYHTKTNYVSFAVWPYTKVVILIAWSMILNIFMNSTTIVMILMV